MNTSPLLNDLLNRMGAEHSLTQNKIQLLLNNVNNVEDYDKNLNTLHSLFNELAINKLTLDLYKEIVKFEETNED